MAESGVDTSALGAAGPPIRQTPFRTWIADGRPKSLEAEVTALLAGAGPIDALLAESRHRSGEWC